MKYDLDARAHEGGVAEGGLPLRRDERLRRHRWADPLGDAIKAARAWCRERCGGGDGADAEKEPLVAVTVDRSSSRGDDA